MDKRIQEAVSLREFFDEQWNQLKRIAKRYDVARQREKRDKADLSDAIELIIQGTDVRMRGIGSYQKRLRSSARGLLFYIRELISRMPAARVIDRQSFNEDPLVNSLFYNWQEVEQILSDSDELKQFCNDSRHQTHTEVFALLQLVRKEKTIFGAEFRGEILMREIPQTYVEFYGHKLFAPESSESRLRKTLLQTLFENVIAYLRDYMTRLRHDMLEEEERRDLPGKGEGINDPQRYLEVLEWLLSMPRELIHLQSNMLRIDSRGIKLPDTVQTNCRELVFNEIAIGKTEPKMVTLVRFPVETPILED